MENKGKISKFSRDSREFRDFRVSRDSWSEKTPFVMTPFSGPENPNFLVRIFPVGGEVFRVNRWAPKSSVCPSKHRETKLLGGTP